MHANKQLVDSENWSLMLPDVTNWLMSKVCSKYTSKTTWETALIKILIRPNTDLTWNRQPQPILPHPNRALFVMQCYAEQPKKKFLMISMHGNNAVVHKTIMLVLG